MTLSRKNWFVLYYKWVKGKYPNDQCSLFWGDLMFILLSPFILTGRMWKYDYEAQKYEYGLMSLIGFATLFLTGILLFILISLGNILLELFGYEFIYNWAFLLGGFGLGILTICAFMAFFIGIWQLFILTKRGVGYVVPETHIIDNTVDFIGAIKGKYCTKITWKD